MKNDNICELVSKVLEYNNCDDVMIEQLYSQPKNLSTNNSKCVIDAAKRIMDAKNNREKVFIGGDYDADGICATTILYDTLLKLDIDTGYYIPDRIKEGYGLSEKTVDMVYEKGYSLIITVDNGVKSFDALKKAKEYGIDVIVTDHHEYEEIPDCKIFVHPKVMENPFKGLCGAGVILQITKLLLNEVPFHIALASIATIGDMMELWDENRIIVKLGLVIINTEDYLSINALFNSYNKSKKTESDISFQVVPKLNATGRLRELANPNQVVKYFLLEDKNEIISVAKNLNEVNEKRKSMTKEMFAIAEKNISNDPFIIINDDRFHEGIVGIVASKIVRDYNRPTLVFTKSEIGYKGSGRSILGFDMQSFFQNDFEELIHFGGHNQAVGCTVSFDGFDTFKNKVQKRYLLSEFDTDIEDDSCVIPCDLINNNSFEKYRELAPFGQGFPNVLFKISGLKIKSLTLNRSNFTKVIFENGWQGLCFSDLSNLEFNNTISVYATLTPSIYKNSSENFSLNIEKIE
ncbi:MAG: DHH family phosphoesterase [Anaerorhabdus sp.]